MEDMGMGEREGLLVCFKQIKKKKQLLKLLRDAESVNDLSAIITFDILRNFHLLLQLKSSRT